MTSLRFTIKYAIPAKQLYIEAVPAAIDIITCDYACYEAMNAIVTFCFFVIYWTHIFKWFHKSPASLV